MYLINNFEHQFSTIDAVFYLMWLGTLLIALMIRQTLWSYIDVYLHQIISNIFKKKLSF